MKRMLNKLWIAVGLLATLPLAAQVDDKYKDYREVYRDSSVVAHTKDVFVEGADGTNPFEVVSNPFRQNWFVFGRATIPRTAPSWGRSRPTSAWASASGSCPGWP